jgi:hypothetical protein
MMTDTVWAAIVGGIAGVVTGSISAVVAPWANWGIEKRRQKLNDRRERIKAWREMVKVTNLQRESFRETTGYSTLRPYLTTGLIDEIERTDINITLTMGGSTPDRKTQLKARILDEIAAIEKQWKLLD